MSATRTTCPACDRPHSFDEVAESYPSCTTATGSIAGREVCLFLCPCGGTVGVRVSDDSGETFYTPLET